MQPASYIDVKLFICFLGLAYLVTHT